MLILNNHHPVLPALRWLKEGAHEFPDNFYRARFNPENITIDKSHSYDDLLMAGIEYKLGQIKATVLIIDNLSCLRGGTESAAVALKPGSE